MRLSIKCPNCSQHFYKNINVLDRRELERKWHGQQQECPHCLRKSKIDPNQVRAIPRKWIGLIAFGVVIGGVLLSIFLFNISTQIPFRYSHIRAILGVLVLPTIIGSILQIQERKRVSMFNIYYL